MSDTTSAIPRFCQKCGRELGSISVTLAGLEYCTACKPHLQAGSAIHRHNFERPTATIAPSGTLSEGGEYTPTITDDAVCEALGDVECYLGCHEVTCPVGDQTEWRSTLATITAALNDLERWKRNEHLQMERAIRAESECKRLAAECATAHRAFEESVRVATALREENERLTKHGCDDCDVIARDALDPAFIRVPRSVLEEAPGGPEWAYADWLLQEYGGGE